MATHTKRSAMIYAAQDTTHHCGFVVQYPVKVKTNMLVCQSGFESSDEENTGSSILTQKQISRKKYKKYITHKKKIKNFSRKVPDASKMGDHIIKSENDLLEWETDLYIPSKPHYSNLEIQTSEEISDMDEYEFQEFRKLSILEKYRKFIERMNELREEYKSKYNEFWKQAQRDLSNANYKKFIHALAQKFLGDKYKAEMSSDWLKNLFWNIYVCIKFLRRCRDFDEFSLIVMEFIDKYRDVKIVFDTKLHSQIKDYILSVFHDMKGFFSPQKRQNRDPSDIEIQGLENYISFSRDILNNYTHISKSPIFQKLYRVLMYSLSFSLLGKFGISFDMMNYTKLEAEAIRRKFYNKSSFVFCILDTLVFIFERGIQCFKTGDLSCIFHSGNTYSKWFDDAKLLERQHLLINDPASHGFTEFDFLQRLSDCIERGDAIIKFMDKKSSDFLSINYLLNSIKMVQTEHLTLRKASESRKPPYAILINGESGIGKSTIKDLLFYQFAQFNKLPNSDEFKYTRNFVAKYWDGFRTSMWATFLDDVAFMNPKVAGQGDPSVMEFLQIINTVPFCPDQAALENKGRTPYKGKLCIATTNTKNLNAHFYFSHATAAQRRFPFIITPEVKEEYSTEQGMLDSSKVPVSEGYPDLWHWNVDKVIPASVHSSQKLAGFEPVLKNASLKTFLTWFNKSMTDHNANQSKVMSSLSKMQKIQYNVCCNLPSTMCSCVMIQSDEFYQSLMIDTKITIFFTFFSYILYSFKERILWYFLKRQYKLTKDRMFKIGEDVKNRIGYSKELTAFIGVLLGAYATYTLYEGVMSFKSNKDDTYETEVNSAESETIFRTPQPDNERVNPWYKDDYEISAFDLSRETTSWKNFSVGQIKEKLQFNCLRLSIKTQFDDENITINNNNAFGIGGHWYISNNHAFKDKDTFEIDIIRGSQMNGVNNNIRIKLNSTDLIRFPDKDLVFFKIRNLPAVRSTLNLFHKSSFNARGNCFMLVRSQDGELHVRESHKVISKSVKFAKLNPHLLTKIWEGSNCHGTSKGDCGSPWIMITPSGPVICGIHVAGDKNVACALDVSVETLEEVLKDQIIFDCGSPFISSVTVKRDIQSLHFKSPLRYIEHGSATVYGSFTGFRVEPKSQVCLTPMFGILSKEGYKLTHARPQMSGYKPWRIACMDMVEPVTNIDNFVVDTIVNEFTDSIISKIPEKELLMAEVYDDFTNINGAAGVTYVDKINRKTSAGNPWKKSKLYFLEPDEPRGQNLDPVKVDKEIMDRVLEMEATYRSGKRVQPNFCAHLKDEPVTFNKAKEGKTRVFTGAPFDFTIIVRRYYLSLIRVIQRNRYTFEAAPGTIAQSREWTEMYHYLTKFGTNKIVAGDYKSYDKKMSPIFILSAFEILIRIAKASGNYTPDDIKVMYGIAEDIAFPLVDFNGDLIQFFGSNPSGHPLTVIINSLVNSIYMRYAYYKLNPNHETLTFQENVSLMTYGDDNIMGISNSIPWFHHTSIQEEFRKIGIIYTMADKEAESEPYIDISQASFLKRSWRWDDEIEEFMPIIEHDSIQRSLMIWTTSKSICSQEQSIEIITSAMGEYFFYGRDIYKQKCELFKRVVDTLDLNIWVKDNTFTPYDEIAKKFKESENLIERNS
jgi:hypothetical protein